MPTVTVSDQGGQLTVSIDNGEPQPVQNAEDACQIVEATFGGGMEEQSEEQAMMSAQKGYGPKNERPTPQQVFGEVG